MNKEILIKQLFYRSIHRGCKETDFLIGEFAKAKLQEIDDLELFDSFIQEDDMKIYDWILGKEEIPAQYGEIVGDIRKFHKIN
jgi:antitoxin CptB